MISLLLDVYSGRRYWFLLIVTDLSVLICSALGIIVAVLIGVAPRIVTDC